MTNTALQSQKAPYDTTAVDSFSAGAIPDEIVMNIKKGSKEFQDSLAQAKKLQAEELKKKKTADSLSQLKKKKGEPEKKTKEAKKEEKKDINTTAAAKESQP